MGKKIRLTESELTHIINETVSNVLTEIDWRTYASAANKALDRGEKIRANRFAFAANTETFSKKDKMGNQMYVEPRVSVKPSLDKNGYSYMCDVRGNNGREEVSSCGSGKYDIRNGYSSTSDFFNGDNGLAKRYDRYKRQADSFNSGKSKYIKGKGWIDDTEGDSEENESLTRRTINKIVRECLKKL